MPDVLLRVTPGVHAHTHTYIATGQNDSKFGFNLANGDAERAAQRAQRSSSVNLVGFHCHIGSNVFVADSFAKAAAVMAEFAGAFDLPELVLGGGLGVAYVAGESAPSTSEWAAAVLDACRSAGVTGGRQRRARPGDRRRGGGHAVHGRHDQADPRRAHVRRRRRRDERQPAPGALRQRVRGDAAAQPARRAAAPGRVVGKHCESGDILIFEAHVPADIAVGDVLAVPVTGAYGHSMGSNYNKVPRPAVVFVERRRGPARRPPGDVRRPVAHRRRVTSTRRR